MSRRGPDPQQRAFDFGGAEAETSAPVEPTIEPAPEMSPGRADDALPAIPARGRWPAVSAEQARSVAADYASGVSLDDLRNRYAFGMRRLAEIIKQAGVPLRRAGQGNAIPRDTEESIISSYQEGMTMSALAEKYTLSIATIFQALQRNDIQSRPSSVKGRKHGRRTTLREDAFDTITEESAYWVGFMMADGCVHEKGDRSSATISLGLSDVDADHIEKFREFLGYSGTVTICKTQNSSFQNSRPQVRISVCSDRLAEALASFGVVPRKSHIAKVIRLENNRDFWRGMIDGDGCLRVQNNSDHPRRRPIPCLGLVGSEASLLQFLHFCLAYIPDLKASVRPMHSIFQLWLNGWKARTMADVLYRDCMVALDRKLEIARLQPFSLDQQKHRGERHFAAILTEAQVIEIRERRAKGESPRELAGKFKVSTMTISAIHTGRIWKHLLPTTDPDS